MQIASLTLANGQATPVDHTFDVVSAQYGNQPSRWMNRNSGSYDGYKEITQSVNRQKASTKVIMKVRLPHLDLEGNVTSQSLFVGNFFISDSATLADREDFFAFVKNLLGDQVSLDAVTKLEPTY